MAVETVLLALLGVVALWLAFDAGRERHRLRARMARSAARPRHEAGGLPAGRDPHGRSAASPPADAWQYWPLTLPSAHDRSMGPQL